MISSSGSAIANAIVDLRRHSRADPRARADGRQAGGMSDDHPAILPYAPA